MCTKGGNNMDTASILKKFMVYAEYDPDQHTFNLLSANYAFHKAIEQIKKITSYDPTGAFAVLHAKHSFMKVLKDCRLNAFEIISKPDSLREEYEMWDIFNSPEVAAVEQSILDSFSNLLDQVQNTPAKLGERNLDLERQSLLSCVEAVVEALPECNEDLFLRGGEIKPTTNFSTNIHVFSWLAECLMALEKAEDGMYLCFIRNCDAPKPEATEDGKEPEGLEATADGYFGFYLKSNGNLLSINERVNESFPGEHKGHRNGRYSDKKQYNLFPYGSIFSYSNFDYKGIAHTHTIDDQKLAFLGLEPNAYIPLVVAMLMLNAKYADTSTAEMPLKLVDSLMTVNLAMPTPGMTDIMVPGDSVIAAVSRSFVLDMTTEGIRTGAYAHKLSRNEDTKDRHWSEFGSFPEYRNIFVELYGGGFELDTASLLESNTHLKRLESAAELPERDMFGKKRSDAPDAEFVGTPIRFEIAAYKRGREQLAEYVRDRMFEEYKAFGGAKAVKQWYREAIRGNLPGIIQLCIERYNRPEGWNWQDEEREHALKIHLQDNPKSFAPEKTGPTHIFFNDYVAFWRPGQPNYGKGLKCCVNTDTRATIFFTFDIRNWREIRRVTGVEDIPKILMGYDEGGHSVVGNSILHPTDACTGIGTPFEQREKQANRRYWDREDWRSYYWSVHHMFSSDCEHLIPKDLITDHPSRVHFQFTIGFSRRGWKKIQNGEMPKLVPENPWML